MNWLRGVEPRPDAQRRMVCFPHAGGSASFFRDWQRSLPDLELHSVQYPGRADRITEPVPTELPAMARDITAELRPLLDRPVALFGHSMGAVLAFEVARMLTVQQAPVAHLFASSARAPHDPDFAPTGVAQRDDESIMRSLSRLGGTEAELVNDPMLRELVMPYVRGDFAMFENYRYRPGPLLTCPVTAINGGADAHVSGARVGMWGEVTLGGFTRRVFPGGHFYLLAHPPFALIRDAFGDCLAAAGARHSNHSNHDRTGRSS